MKKTKLFSALALVAVFCVSFTACDKSNDPKDEDNTGSNGSGSANGHEYVDLGLSVKWATMNVGAGAATEYGDYFAWGETKPKSDYSWSTYKYGSGDEALTKYNTRSDLGDVDNKTVLDLSDDAARANWGGQWRMPTDAECQELEGKCTWVWTEIDGVNGYRVSRNGNSIFLPAAGYRDASDLYDAGSDGSYWSSSLFPSNPYVAFCLDFNSHYLYLNDSYRYYGLSVRPVLP